MPEAPQLSDDILPHPKLVEQLLRAVRNRRLTLISAPAGSGRAVTAASLGRASTELTLAWLALDEEDDDPVTFLWLLAAALNRRFPDCGTKAMALLKDDVQASFRERPGVPRQQKQPRR